MKNEINITGNIRAIEMLKTQIISEVARLYEELQKPGYNHECIDHYASLVIAVYLLAGTTGIGFDELDAKIINRLRLLVLEDESVLQSANGQLLRHLNKQ